METPLANHLVMTATSFYLACILLGLESLDMDHTEDTHAIHLFIIIQFSVVWFDYAVISGWVPSFAECISTPCSIISQASLKGSSLAAGSRSLQGNSSFTNTHL